MIMARELKRQLLHSEVIIHLDGNRANNDRDNLRLTDKSGAMQYRRDNPRSREPSKREFIVRMEFVVKTSGDAFIGDVADTIETAFDNNEFVGYLSDDDTFVIAAARVQTVRAVIKS
jgi:arginine repressor